MSVILSSRLQRRLRLSSLRALAEKVLRAAGAGRAALSLLLVGDRFMRRLNRLYRRKNRTTDVLAFPMRVTRHPSRAFARRPVRRKPLESGSTSARRRVTPDLLGDIVISLPQAERQAAQAGHTLEREMAVLVIHGLLHLLGYDHERSAREARRMSRRERAVLRAMGRHLS